MCSCYVGSRNSDSKEEESRRIRGNNRKKPNGSEEKVDDGGLFISRDSESRISMDKKRGKSINASDGLQVEGSSDSNSSSAALKSNLKRSASMVEISPKMMMNQGMRKVSWSDAHGKDIAHVQEFEPSKEAELEGVGNSCKCAIQ